MQLYQNETSAQVPAAVNGMQLLLNRYRTLFGEDVPKGFGKFGGSKPKSQEKSNADEEAKKSTDKEANKTKPQKDEDDLSDIYEKYPGQKKKPESVFKFKMEFGGGGNRKGRSDGSKETLFTTGVIGTGLLIAAISYYKYSYEEISWKDLTT